MLPVVLCCRVIRLAPAPFVFSPAAFLSSHPTTTPRIHQPSPLLSAQHCAFNWPPHRKIGHCTCVKTHPIYIPPHSLTMPPQRRSLIESIRGDSPFGAPSISSTFRVPPIEESNDGPATPKPKHRSPPKYNSQKVTLRLVDKEKPRRRSKIRKAAEKLGITFKLTPWDHLENPAPAFERSNDFMVVTDIPVRPTAYIQIISPDLDKDSYNQTLFSLPSLIRRRIYGFCFPPQTRHVSLSPYYAIKNVWEYDHFANPWDILKNVKGGLESFHLLREDLYTFFWSEYHFHVTITAFSGPHVSPLSHTWLHEHLSRVQALTLEVDYTRFGGNCVRQAPIFGYNMDKEDKLLANIFNDLAIRADGSTIWELNVLCRRYAGFQPYNDSAFVARFGKDPVPYCPESVLQLSDAICNLADKLHKLRIVAYPIGYSRLLLNAMFAKGFKEPKVVVPEDSVWPVNLPTILPSPFAPKIHSVITTSGKAPDEQTEKTPTPASYKLNLKRSPSLVEEFENELQRYASSSSSNYTSANENTIIEQLEEKMLANGFSHADYSRVYTNLVPAFSSSASESTDDLLSISSSQYSPATPRFQTFGDLLDVEDTRQRSSTKKGVRFNRLVVEATPERLPTPNTMNEINEKDPAFLRSVSAMRGVASPNSWDSDSGCPTPPRIMLRSTSVQGPRRPSFEFSTQMRSGTSMSMANLRHGSLRQKCSSFFQKIRSP